MTRHRASRQFSILSLAYFTGLIAFTLTAVSYPSDHWDLLFAVIYTATISVSAAKAVVACIETRVFWVSFTVGLAGFRLVLLAPEIDMISTYMPYRYGGHQDVAPVVDLAGAIFLSLACASVCHACIHHEARSKSSQEG